MARKSLLVDLLLLCLAVMTAKGQRVGFSETDYFQKEGEGKITVGVSKLDRNSGTLSFVLTPLTYKDFQSMGFTIPEEQLIIPDPAEYVQDGRQDFVEGSKVLQFPPSSNTETLYVSFDVILDDIYELDEGFFVIIEVDEEGSDSLAVQDVKLSRNVTLAIIGNDDAVFISFNEPSFTVSEGDGVLDSLISISLNGLSEISLPVTLAVSVSSAQLGEDFTAGMFPRHIAFQPGDSEFAVPINITEDLVPEKTENFVLILITPTDASGYSLAPYPDVSVTIVDDDMLTLGFEHAEYLVREGDGSIEVCVIVSELEVTRLIAFGHVSTEDGSAHANTDYESIDRTTVRLPRGNIVRQCFDLVILDDNQTESTEMFQLTLNKLFLTASNVIFQPNVTTVIIVDDESTEVDVCSQGTHNCDQNANCTATSEGFICSCVAGYTGNGTQCHDINECVESMHHCHTNSWCLNNVGSYECMCHKGYIGDGIFCTKEEVKGGEVPDCSTESGKNEATCKTPETNIQEVPLQRGEDTTCTGQNEPPRSESSSSHSRQSKSSRSRQSELEPAGCRQNEPSSNEQSESSRSKQSKSSTGRQRGSRSGRNHGSSGVGQREPAGCRQNEPSNNGQSESSSRQSGSPRSRRRRI